MKIVKRLGELPGFRLRNTIESFRFPISDISFSPDGNFLALALQRHPVRLWNTRSSKNTSTPQPQFGSLRTAWSPKGDVLVSYGDKEKVVLYNLAEHTVTKTLLRNGGDFSWSPDGSVLAYSHFDTLKFLDGDMGKTLKRIQRNDVFLDLCWAPNGQKIVCAHQDGRLRLWNVSKGTIEQVSGPIVHNRTIDHSRMWLASARWRHEEHITCLRWSAFGVIAAGTSGGAIRLYDERTLRPAGTITCSPEAVSTILFSDTGRIMLSASEEDTVRLWCCDAWESLAVSVGGEGSNHKFKLHYDRPILAVFSQLANFRSTVQVWDFDETEALKAVSKYGIPYDPTAMINAENSPRLKVFLCHAKEDKVVVRDLHRRLAADNVQPWLDEEDLLPGQDWATEIPKVVRKSHIFLVCLSQRSVTKFGYVQKEIKYALDVADEQPEGTIFIIPVKLEPCEIPDRLKRLHYVNLYEPGGYEKLIKSLQVRISDLDSK